MNSTQAILDEMSRRGVTVRIEGKNLRLKPREALDDNLLARVRQHKPEIIRALVQVTPPAPFGDYDVDLWSSEKMDRERRLDRPYVRLFPYLFQKVRTPGGPGILLRVLADRATVLLDSDLSKCTVFSPEQIRAVAMRSAD